MPREPWFVRWSHTTHPNALMHVIGGNREYCRDNGVDDVASFRAHAVADLERKGHL